MKPEFEEHVTYYREGGQCEHSFTIDRIFWGECIQHHENGQLWIHCFYVDNKYHGLYEIFNDRAERARRTMFVNGEYVDIPYLGQKPKRLHNRSRFNMLEI